MKPARFDYIRVDSCDEAVELLAEYGDEARILAGGQSLMPILNMRLAQPRVLIDISRAADLSVMRVDNGSLCIGAAQTQSNVEGRVELVREVPLLARAIPHIGHFQTRNRGTVCGSIAHADPSAELPLCLAALDGAVVLRSKAGRRRLRAEALFTGTLATAREPTEILEEARFPLARNGERHGFVEFAMRHGDFAIVAVAAVVAANEIRVAVGGVADRPRMLRIARIADDELDGALNDFAWDLDARDDQHASAAYRRHLVRRLGGKLIRELQS